MKGGSVIKRARQRAGISQAELARRLGTQQPVVARWESGARSPSFETVGRAVEACGLALDVGLIERDPGEDALLHQWQHLTPTERVDRNEQILMTEEWLRKARPVDRTEDRARG